jgi:hypothetical protein
MSATSPMTHRRGLAPHRVMIVAYFGDPDQPFQPIVVTDSRDSDHGVFDAREECREGF